MSAEKDDILVDPSPVFGSDLLHFAVAVVVANPGGVDWGVARNQQAYLFLLTKI